MEKMDFLKNEDGGLKESTLKTLSEMSMKLTNLKKKANDEEAERIIKGLDERLPDVSIETIELVLKTYKNRERVLSRSAIPSILNDCGLSEIKLKSGEKITVADKVKASITNGNKEMAFVNMVKAEQDNGLTREEALENTNALFKSFLKLDLDDTVIQYCLDNDVLYETERNIHWQTLNKYCSGLLESGRDIPEGISVFQYQEAKVK